METKNVCGGCTLRIAVGITVLALLLAGSTEAATLTVNASGGADYTRIQDAIDNASADDTILVYSGTYYENVNVGKPLIIKGIDNGGGKPVVDAGESGSDITLDAGNSTLEGFKAVNANWPNYGIHLNSSNNVIKNNIASNNSNGGIFLSYSSNNTLSGNTASNNSVGIFLLSFSNNTLVDNMVSNNRNWGIFLGGIDNILIGNNATNNQDGIYVFSSRNNTLSGNTASNNRYSGISLRDSSNNTLSDNRASNNIYSYVTGGYGIYLSSSSNNTLSNNTASNNIYGIYLDYSSIAVDYSPTFRVSSSNNVLSGNNADSNNIDGITLSSSSNNTLSGNNASNNGVSIGGVGIHLELSSNNMLTDNNVLNNNQGIRLSNSNNNLIYHNNFINNTVNAFDYRDFAIYKNLWNAPITIHLAGGNYWSDYNGTDANKDSIGDAPYNISGSAGAQDRYPFMKVTTTPPGAQAPTPKETSGFEVAIAASAVLSALYIIRKR